MKKMILILSLGFLFNTALAQSDVSQGAAVGRALTKAVMQWGQITRDEKDPRLLHFMGDTYKMHLGTPNIANYWGPQKRGIVVSRQSLILVEALYGSIDALTKEGYTVKSQDGRNPEDILVTMSRRGKNGINYKVLRFFPGKNSTTYATVVGRLITDKDPLPIMRSMVQGIRQTPQQVLTSGFPKEECEFGDDCY